MVSTLVSSYIVVYFVHNIPPTVICVRRASCSLRPLGRRSGFLRRRSLMPRARALSFRFFFLLVRINPRGFLKFSYESSFLFFCLVLEVGLLSRHAPRGAIMSRCFGWTSFSSHLATSMPHCSGWASFRIALGDVIPRYCFMQL